jgi:hypothetical protein
MVNRQGRSQVTGSKWSAVARVRVLKPVEEVRGKLEGEAGSATSKSWTNSSVTVILVGSQPPISSHSDPSLTISIYKSHLASVIPSSTRQRRN